MSKMSDERITSVPDVVDENVVDWDGPDDPASPLNWTSRKRAIHAVIISATALVVNLASTMYAPGAPLLMRDLSITSSIVGAMTVSIYLLGFAVGPLLVAPLSELYGRLIIYQVCNSLFFVFTLACALSTNVGMFLAFRFLAGCAGSHAMTIGGGVIADTFPQERRGAVMGLFGLGPLIGPIVGPVAGGYISQNIGWRWTFWVMLILSGIVTMVIFVFMRETYGRILLERKAARLRKENNNPALRSKLDKGIPINTLITQSIVRPMKILVLSPIVLLLSSYVAFAFGLTFVLFTTFPMVYGDKYHFSEGTIGLSYLGMGVGFGIGIVAFAILSDRVLKAQTAKDQANIVGVADDKHDATIPIKYKPEHRLLLMVYVSPILPIGIFIYGWTADKGVHWLVPILGTGIIGIGGLFIMMPAQSYLVDVFGSEGAASALAANTILRSLFGTFLPLAGPPLYASLGLGWGNSLLGFIGLAFIPIPYFFWKYGEGIRRRHPVRL